MVIVSLPPKGCELIERIFPFYFGDATGDPGTILIFFTWPRARRDHWGNGQVAETSFSIPEGALAYWQERL